jgi:hypothetical protein
MMGEAEDWLPDAARMRNELTLAAGEVRIYALIDGARVKGVATLLGRMNAQYASLFRGDADVDYAEAGPYLALVPIEHDLLTLFVVYEPMLAATLFLAAGAEFEQMRTHLRRFLKVLDSQGKRCFFRFYDARVLAVYLGAAEPVEQAQLFGPIRSMHACGPDRDVSKPLLRSWQAPEGVAVSRYPDVNHPLCLRPEQEAAFAKDMLERYCRRAVEYLRQEHPIRAAKTTDEELLEIIGRARETAPQLRLNGGRDVTRMSEMMLLGLEAETLAELECHVWYHRPRALEAFRDKTVQAEREQSSASGAGV